MTWYEHLLLSILFLLAVLFLYFKNKYEYWNRRGVINTPGTIPFGNGEKIMTQKLSLGTETINIYNKYKSMGARYAGYYLLDRPIFIPLDPELINSILASSFQHFTDRGFHINEEVNLICIEQYERSETQSVKIDPLGAHLFNLKGKKWRNLRTALSPTFTAAKSKMMFPILLDCASQLSAVLDNAIEEDSSVEFVDLMERYTTDVVVSCAFGMECNSVKDPSSIFLKYAHSASRFYLVKQLKYLIVMLYPQFVKVLRVRLVDKDTKDFFLNTCNQMVDYRNKNNIIRKDFMHSLIQLKNNNPSRKKELKEHEIPEAAIKGNTNAEDCQSETAFNMNQMAAQVLLFFLAGQETSSQTLVFLFYELAINQHLQDKVRKEIDETLLNHNGNITYDDLKKLELMSRCIDEALRKYTPLPMYNRECTKPFKVPGSDLVLEKGQSIFIPVLGLHHDPEYYPDPQRFDPERFTEGAKATRHPSTWLPFGEGPRSCIARSFAYTLMKVLAVSVLKDYKLSLDSLKTKTPIVFHPKRAILTPIGGIWLSVEKI